MNSLVKIAFAVGKGYFMLLIARAMQGFSSACISICGMSIIAQVKTCIFLNKKKKIFSEFEHDYFE